MSHRATDRTAPPLPSEPARAALFLDIDGTLAGFRHDPRDVHLSTAVHAVLQRLHAQLDGAIAILTGRTLDDADRLLAPLRLATGAMHGAQCRDAHGSVVSAAVPAGASRVSDACAAFVHERPAVRLECKSGIGFALHYRGAPACAGAVADAANRIAAASRGEYVVIHGDCVAELVPHGINKGGALHALMDTAPFRGRVPIAMGDDVTDEDAFAAVPRYGGCGICVGTRRPTVARHALRDPAGVLRWLEALDGALGTRT